MSAAQLAAEHKVMIDGLFELALLHERARKANKRRAYKRKAKRLNADLYTQGWR